MVLPGGAPPDFHAWFHKSPAHPFPPGGGKEPPRRDDYLKDPSQATLGIKVRGGGSGVDVKSLVSRVALAVSEGPFQGDAEIWIKVTSKALKLAPEHIITTNKRRWMRKFDTSGKTPREKIKLDADENPVSESPPKSGCNVEITSVEISGKVWWTFGFKSFGELGLVAEKLRTVAALLASRQPPDMGHPVLASYPAWLSDRTSLPVLSVVEAPGTAL